jgi:DNA polymerase/3'-5' exonuclease PolX
MSTVTTATSTDYKTLVLEALKTLQIGEKAAGPSGKFKAIAYAKAITSVKGLDGPLTDAKQVKNLDGIGTKIYEKITEIIATGASGAVERMKERTDVDAFSTLLGIHGVGPVKARELLAAGFTTIAALRAAPKGTLNDTQLMGLKHYEDGLLRIPRGEMETHETVLLGALSGTALTGTIVGSYRRGAADSGDIDMLVTYPVGMTTAAAGKLFKSFVKRITDGGYVVDALASGAKKWLGYVRLGEGYVRRLDLLLTPPEEFAYAILYFTGSDKFNVAMRRFCTEKGFTLNEHRMAALKEGGPVIPPMKTEADIFAFLGLKFVAPTARVDGRQIQVVA